MSALSSPPASDLAAAREDIEFILGGERFVDTPQLRESLRTLLSSLGDGDDSARPHPEQIVERAAQLCDRFGYLNAGKTVRRFSRQIIDAARTAPGGASNA